MQNQKKNYKINPKYSLIFKTDNTLLCTDKNSKIIKFKISSNDVSLINTILDTENFKYYDNKVFLKLLKKKVIIELEKKPNLNTELYLNNFFNKNVNLKDLNNKTIAIVGLGGIGTEVLEHLIGVGIKNYVLIDYDKVEVSNLNRQYMFELKDLGKNKVDIVELKILSKLKDALIQTEISKISEKCELVRFLKNKKIDFLICAADNPFFDIRIAILEFCFEYNVPCIFGGVNIINGQVGPLLSNRNNIKKYLLKLISYKKYVQNYNTNKASFGPTNTIISSYIAKDVIFYLLGENKEIISLNKIVEFNFQKKGGFYNEKQF